MEWADRQGLDLAQAGQIEPRLRTWYNPEQKSSDFLIPGLMVVIIMIVTIQQTAVTLVREREQGTGEQMTVSLAPRRADGRQVAAVDSFGFADMW